MIARPLIGLVLAALGLLLLIGVFVRDGAPLLVLPAVLALGGALYIWLPRQAVSRGTPPPPVASTAALPRPKVKTPATPDMSVPDAELLERIYSLSPAAFELFAARLLAAIGYRQVQVVGKSGDNGVDIRCYDRAGRLCVAQCKRYRGTVPPAVVRELLGVMSHEGAIEGLLITTGRVSRQAEAWAGLRQIHVIDAPRLVFHARRYVLQPK